MNTKANEQFSFELLADYVDGLVDQQTAKRIETRIEEDETTAAIVDGIRFYYEDQQADREGLEVYLQNFKARLVRGIEENPNLRTEGSPNAQPNQPLQKSPSFFTPFRIAAAIALLIGASFIFQQLGSKTTNPVVAQLEEVYPSPVTTRAGDTPALTPGTVEAQLNELKSQATAAYVAGAFDRAATAFDELLELAPASDEWMFYAAISRLYAKEYSGSLTAFNQLTDFYQQNGAGLYTQQATWYKSLALYQAGQKNDALADWLAISKQSNHYKQGQAAELYEVAK